MKKTGKRWTLWVGLAFGLVGTTATWAQVEYSQPGYSQPGYNNQRGYSQPGYNQPGYPTQPDYNQRNYGQPYGQDPGQGFYDELGPYGQWVQTPEYGNVWIPDVEPGFQPYATNGHWVITEYGNTWISDYSWGWAPFHYGRWYLDRYRGWAWVPGNEWAPAWVSWRSGGGYYGWAPLGPIQAGPGGNFNANVNIPPHYWVFVPQAYITSPRLFNYYAPRPRVVNIYQNTTIINNVYRANNRVYAYGPRREEIEYVTRRSVPVYRIEDSRRPGRDVVRGNAIGIYRPNMNRRGRDNGNPYSNDQRSYQRREYDTNWGSDNVDPRANQVDESQRYTQPQRQGANPSGQWSRDRRQESVPQQQSSDTQAGSAQTQEQRTRGYDQRNQTQSQVPPSTYPERRGNSRGPR
jgi:hypothetical protein